MQLYMLLIGMKERVVSRLYKQVKKRNKQVLHGSIYLSVLYH